MIFPVSSATCDLGLDVQVIMIGGFYSSTPRKLIFADFIYFSRDLYNPGLRRSVTTESVPVSLIFQCNPEFCNHIATSRSPRPTL
jgi:hypothetical protein